MFMLGVFGAVAVAGAVQQDPTVMWWGIALGVLGGAYPTYAAVHGGVTTTECRDVRSMQLACISGVEEDCRALRNRGRPDGEKQGP